MDGSMDLWIEECRENRVKYSGKAKYSKLPVHAKRIQHATWNPRSTAEAFLIQPLCLGWKLLEDGDMFLMAILSTFRRPNVRARIQFAMDITTNSKWTN